MTVAQLAHPEWLATLCWTLLAIGIACGAAVWQQSRRRTLLMGVSRGPTARKWSSDFALWFALVAIAIALLGPRIGERLVAVTASGVDLVIAIDVSRSMDAPDTPPSRLDRARRGVEQLLSRLESADRVALVAFAGHGVLLTPLTPDRFALVEWIAALDTDLIRPSSSNLESAVAAAARAFEAGSERPRVIAILSDGEDPNGADELGAATAIGVRSRVIAIALGTELGSAIPSSGAALRDRVGRVVVTRRDSERLAKLANATSGAVFPADRWGEFDFDAVTAEIRRDAGAVLGDRVERWAPAVRVAPFAALALILLLAEGLPRERFVWGRRAGALTGLATVAIALVGASAESKPSDSAQRAAATRPSELAILDTRRQEPQGPPPEAIEPWVRREPHNPRALLALGHARLAHGDAPAAAAAFSAAALYASDDPIAAASHFGLGVSQLEAGELEAARDAFFDTLAFDPSNDKARFNLEWAIAAMVETPPPRAPSPRPESDPETEDDSRPEPADADASESGTDTDTDTDESASETSPKPEPQPGGETAPTAGSATDEPTAAPLSEQQQLRSLARVSDDLGRSIRSAVQAERDIDESQMESNW